MALELYFVHYQKMTNFAGQKPHSYYSRNGHNSYFQTKSIPMKQTSIKALIFGVFAAVLLAVPLTLHSTDKPQEQTPEQSEVKATEEEPERFCVVAHVPNSITVASFPGGESAMYAFLCENLCYPAQKDKLEGMVVIRFTVERDGSLDEFSIVKSVSPELDAEAIRVVKQMPKWEPGTEDGVPVRYIMSLPITFKLTEEEVQ